MQSILGGQISTQMEYKSWRLWFRCTTKFLNCNRFFIFL